MFYFIVLYCEEIGDCLQEKPKVQTAYRYDSKGYLINHKTVLKLMNELGLKGKQRKNDKYHSYKGEVGKIADNLLKRDFYASKPFEKLTTDVTIPNSFTNNLIFYFV